MGLAAYNKKRKFGETPEPKGKEKHTKGTLRFVVQKHDASSLHYDFRLEMEGVLKSWAVPKGPSLDPADKRLAMMVEDHPLDYRTFEGVIPEGNYGGGTVIVWDEGTYEPVEGEGLEGKEKEKTLLAQLKNGSLKIRLKGKKLQGEFNLRLMKGRGERSWILVKKKDDFASGEDITEQNRSVKSGKTIAQVAEEGGTTPHHPEEDIRAKTRKKPAKVEPDQAKPLRVATAGRKRTRQAVDLKALLGDRFKVLKKTAMPGELTPMLATLVNEPFDSGQWIFEIKWDGYRSLAYCSGSSVELISRNKKPFTDKYKPVSQALAALNMDAVFDGEIVAVDDKGLANFQALQNWQNTPVRLQFFIFDVIWLQGYDLSGLTLLERKKILQQCIPADDEVLKYSDHVVGKGNDFFKVALGQGLEGIMAKKADSLYQSGVRTEDWVKIKVNLRQEVVIAGYTEPRNTRQFFGSLLLGIYDEGKLQYVGHTGSGFDKKGLEAIHRKLQPLVTGKSPFEKAPKTNMPATWVKPKLVCEIKFTEWTKDRMARHPIFMGLRSDKKPQDVVFEKAKDLSALAAKPKAAKSINTVAAGKKAKGTARKTGKASSIVIPEEANEASITLNGQELSLTNLQKPYWKKEGFTKGDMIRYYLEMAPFIMPYMKDRPQSMNRHPNGVGAPNFFQKDTKGKVPGWMVTHQDFSESTDTTVEYLVCANEATLIYMANLGCIEMNPWHARSQSWQQPDWCLIDLDPDKTNSFEQVVDTAHAVKRVLDAIGADCCVKTSGSTGIHIYIPLGAKYSFEQSRQLAELVVNLVNSEMPDLTSVERNPAKRKGKIYLDFLQNRETQTAAAPYSLRPKPGVPVSTPLDWSEVRKGLTPTTWHARNIMERLKAEGDLFKKVLGKGISLDKVMSKLTSLIS